MDRESAEMLNQSKRRTQLVAYYSLGLLKPEARSAADCHTSDESDCPACRARAAQWTGSRNTAAYAEFAEQGLKLHSRGNGR